MGKISVVIGIVLLCIGCTDKVSQEDLRHLNGYWEITKVTFPNGSSKEYNLNLSVDYIEYNDLKGFRKKVQPKLDGTYDTSNDSELFTILEKEGVFELYYKNDLSEWKEQIVALSENNFTVVNAENITYTYKRFQPINVMAQ